MLIFHSPDTQLRRARTELAGGALVAPFECPERVDMILAALHAQSIGEVRLPSAHGLGPVRRVHSGDYVDFLVHAWDDWTAAGFTGDAIATVWPSRHTHIDRVPKTIEGRIGYYALAAETSIDAGTFAAAQASADIAVSGMDHVLASAEPVFALCRPPGHHATVDQFGGYCFFCNAAVAAQRALDGGAARVAILDIDYHHGNGTQQIFYERDDVLFLSLHAEPSHEFPYFSGHVEETGAGAGRGFTRNFPMPHGTGYRHWAAALDQALAAIAAFDADTVIVSLGVDTYTHDPISHFCLERDDFNDCGRRIAALGRPTLLVMEGGYAVEDIGLNVTAVLAGFDGG